MLRSTKSLEGFAIGATDGDIGKVKNFYFDDEAWVIRYVVVDTRPWLGGREVLISPYSIGQPDWAGDVLPAKITKDQVKAKKYDLSASRYRHVEQDNEFYERPDVTLKRLGELEAVAGREVAELKEALHEV